MSQYKIQPSQVLIVPGYTNEEILAMSAKTGDSTAAAIKNATKSEDKTRKDEDTDKSEDSSTKSSTSTSSSSKSSSSSQKNQLRKSSSQPSFASEAKTSAKKQAAITAATISASKVTGTKKTSYASSSKQSTSTTSTSKITTTKKTSKASSKTKTTSKKSSKNSSKNNSKNNVNESSAATATESTTKVEKPKALLFSPTDVEYTAHRPDYEEFNAAEGLILIEKACDQFAELQLSLSVHQAMRIQENGTLELSDDDKRPIDIITSGAPTVLDEQTQLGHFMDPADFTDSYIEIRRSFFDKYLNRPLTLISDLFPIMAVCYITELSYNINEGEETAEYSITFREVDNTWG